MKTMVSAFCGWRLRTAIAALLLAVLSGCSTLSGVPAIVRAEIQPATLKPGDAVRVELEVKDKHSLVTRVQGEVKEEPQRTFALRDDGVEPDAKANDGIWTLAGIVPPNAPAGTFHLVFTAYSGKKTPVPVRHQGHVTPLQAEAVVTIQAAQP